MEAQIKELFKEEFWGNNLTVEVTKHPEEVWISVTAQYEKPEMVGTLAETLQAISRITGLPEVDEGQSIEEGGCETCDYGSQYGFTFRAFR